MTRTIDGTYAAARQRKFIQDARLLLEPREVRLHKLPPWLVKRLVLYRKAHALGRMPPSMVLSSCCHTSGWLDHWGTSGSDFVAEPYSFGEETARELTRFCDELGGLEWRVSSNAWWFPGSTVRITVREKSGK